jgi:hypothetical protein
MTADAKTDTLAWALLGVQKDMPAIQPNAKNPHFKNEYISLDHLLAVALPVLHKHNLVLVQSPAQVDGKPTLTTTIFHAPSGESLHAEMPLILDRENSQGQGSAITYAKRYMLASMLGISSEKDDDGEAASKAAEKPPKAQRAPAVPRGEKMRLRIQELASEADKMREADPGLTWDEVTKVIAWRDEQYSQALLEGHPDPGPDYGKDWDSLSEDGLVWLGNELKAYVAAGQTGITFFEHVTVPF